MCRFESSLCMFGSVLINIEFLKNRYYKFVILPIILNRTYQAYKIMNSRHVSQKPQRFCTRFD